MDALSTSCSYQNPFTGTIATDSMGTLNPIHSSFAYFISATCIWCFFLLTNVTILEWTKNSQCNYPQRCSCHLSSVSDPHETFRVVLSVFGQALQSPLQAHETTLLIGQGICIFKYYKLRAE